MPASRLCEGIARSRLRRKAAGPTSPQDEAGVVFLDKAGKCCVVTREAEKPGASAAAHLLQSFPATNGSATGFAAYTSLPCAVSRIAAGAPATLIRHGSQVN